VSRLGRAVLGRYGVTARIVVGAGLVGSVLVGHANRRWHPMAWLVGPVLPTLVLAGMWWRARRHRQPLRPVGPLSHAVPAAVFAALYLTWWYAPATDILSDAALLFYGG
jgi:hypothetical protein